MSCVATTQNGTTCAKRWVEHRAAPGGPLALCRGHATLYDEYAHAHGHAIAEERIGDGPREDIRLHG